MLSRLVQRVLPRTLAPGVAASVGLRPSLLARQHLVARTFLTTAYVAEPAAKGSKPAAKKAATSKATSGRKKATKKTKPKTKAKPKAKPKTKAKKKATKPAKDDPDARFKKGLKAVKIAKSERPPLKSITTYSLYLRDQCGAIGNPGAFATRSKELAARWRAMSDEEKQPYKDQAAEARKKFEQDRMEWFTKTDPRILRALNMQRKAKNLPLVHVPAGVRPKRPMGSYMLFSNEVRDTLEFPDLGGREALIARSRKIAEMWNGLSPEQKQRYTDEYKKNLAEFKAALQA
ncbi:hypothetical protein C8Q76DRAFT_737489 [Earliella scabrosa]|nr:hypothetical protein C8Q76DRAFT_737489 [Earliella scabrosa]